MAANDAMRQSFRIEVQSFRIEVQSFGIEVRRFDAGVHRLAIRLRERLED